MATVSVIIPCYNTARYINKCINALEKQLFKDFEIIIIDDCSTDNTVDVIEQIKKATELSINLIRNTVNSGPAVSRNKGIMAATSEYITFCDSDDWYESDYLLKMTQALRDANGDIVFCGYRVVDSKGKIDERPLDISKSVSTINEALLMNVDSLCMMMVKTEIMQAILLPDIRNGEDMAVVPLLIERSTCVKRVPNCLYNYYRRSSSSSEVANISVVNALRKSFNYIMENLSAKYSTECELIGIRNLLYSSIIILFRFSKDVDRANEIINDFELVFPNWNKNPYITELPFYKRIVLFFIKKRQYHFVRLLSALRSLLIK
jgi:glycosyltransferase involved in cell wall biosynthesis